MYRKIKAEIQIIFSLLFVITILIVLSSMIGSHVQSPLVAAQGPRDVTPSPFPINNDTLAAYGLSQDEVQISNGTFSLQVNIIPSGMALNSGSNIEFTIQITNLGPDEASFLFLYNDLPAQLSNLQYQFIGTEGFSNGQPKPTWLLTGPIASGDTASVVVTGVVNSACNVSVSNTAQVSAFTDPTVYQDGITINITGSQGSCNGDLDSNIYLPLMKQDPTPTPNPVAFEDDFSDDDSGWPEYNDGDCDSAYDDGEYRLDVDQDETCFRFAPQEAERRIGEFRVVARVTDGNDEYAYGIYMNGQGGDNYYLFRVRSNDNCGWELIRRKSGNSTTVRQGGCASAIKRGEAKNALKITHTKAGQISVYVNGELLRTYNDSSPLTGKGTGVYARADQDSDLTARFDNFKVLRILP